MHDALSPRSVPRTQPVKQAVDKRTARPCVAAAAASPIPSPGSSIPTCARLTTSLALELAALWFAGSFWYFRDGAGGVPMAVSLAFAALALISLGVAAAIAPAITRIFRAGVLLTCVLAPCSALLAYAAGGLNESAALWCVIGLAGWAPLSFSLIGSVIALMGLRLNARIICSAIAAVIACTIRVAARALLFQGQSLLPFIIAMAMCLAACLLSRPEAARAFDVCAQTGSAPADLELTQPSSFLPLRHRLFIMIACYGFVSGLSFYFGIASTFINATALSTVPLIVLVLIRLKTHRPMSLDALYIIAFVLAVGAFLSIGFVQDEEMMLTVALFGAQEACFYVLMVTLLTSLALRNPRNAVVVCAWGLGLFMLGWGPAAFAFNLAALHMVEEVPLLVFPLGLAFVSFNAVSLRYFSVDADVEGIEPASEVTVGGSRTNGTGAEFPRTGEATRTVGEPGAHVDGIKEAREGFEGATPAGSWMAGTQATMDRARQGDAAEAAESDASQNFKRRIAELSERTGLTEREREILELLARGRNARYMQDQLSISRNTAKSHIAHVYAKLGIHNQQEVIDLVESNS